MHSTADLHTKLLHDAHAGSREASEALFTAVYAELRALAASKLDSERADHTLQPTALVHEAYLKLIDQTRVDWRDRRHFFAVAAEVIRRILVDHARSKNADKRGGGQRRVSLESADRPSAATTIDHGELDNALRELAALSERQARVVELRFYGGLDVPTVAELLGVSERTVVGDWQFARAWLQKRLQASDGIRPP